MADLPAGRQAHYLKICLGLYFKSLNRNYIYVGMTSNVTRRFD